MTQTEHYFWCPKDANWVPKGCFNKTFCYGCGRKRPGKLQCQYYVEQTKQTKRRKK